MRALPSVAVCGLALAMATSIVGEAQGQAPGAKPADAAASPKPKPSKADQARAGKLFKDGERAYAKHDYDAAAKAFEEAYSIAPHPDALLNAVDARERAGDLRIAALLCDRLAADYPDDAEVKSAVRGRLAGLSPKLGRIDLTLAGETKELTIDGEAVEPGQIWVDPGDHVLRATVDGELVERKVNVVAGAREALRMEPPPPEPEKPLEPDAPAAPPASSGGLHPAFFFVGAGATAVLGGLTVWSGLDTNGARDDFDANPTQAGLDDGLGKQTRTNVLLGVTGGVAVVSAVVGVFFTDWGGGDAASGADTARVRLDVGLGSATISGSF